MIFFTDTKKSSEIKQFWTHGEVLRRSWAGDTLIKSYVFFFHSGWAPLKFTLFHSAPWGSRLPVCFSVPPVNGAPPQLEILERFPSGAGLLAAFGRFQGARSASMGPCNRRSCKTRSQTAGLKRPHVWPSLQPLRFPKEHDCLGIILT